MTNTIKNVYGTFKQRGDESIKYLPTLTEFAQENFIKDIINVGEAGRYWISVVTTYTTDGSQTLQMVKRGTYDMMDFTSEDDLKAFNNMDKRVQIFLGAYSSKFECGVGFEI